MAGTIARDGVTFTWGHRGKSPSERIVGTLQAPTRGWVAAGFNDTPSLAGTRFVIAAVSVLPIRVEMHVALVPEHPPIETLGGHSGLNDVDGKFSAGVSQVSFSLPTQLGEPYPANLAAGHTTYLMLAWSVAPEFDHHSAWRQHFATVL